MAKHLSVGSIIEKNKIASEETFLILMDAIIRDEDGKTVNTLRFVKNSENIVFDGQAYQAANFSFDISMELNSEPTIKLSAEDQTRTLAQYIEAYAGLVNSTVIMTVVNSGALSGPAEIQETFKIMSASVNEYVVDFDLGTDSAVNKRWPQYRQFKDRCPWRFKSKRCGYTGPMSTCDYTLAGGNGCMAHANVKHFGGFPGLNGNG
jgi:phage-related protein